MKLAVIPARGGSKRIPRKNIKPFCGKPMIAWSIEAALSSGCFDEVVVSTDDNEIAEVAKAYGASAPFKRPATLADDHTPTVPVIKHAVEHYQAAGAHPEQVCCIYATAPFISEQDIQAGFDKLTSQGAAYALSVTSFPFPIQRALHMSGSQRLAMFYPDHALTRSQDLEEAWHDAGQFYWGQADSWLNEKPIFSENSVGIAIPRHRAQDIDTPEDWTRAEWLFKAMQAGQ
ncbi:pseudaminic acid cytidylyltransferase [Idiomarina sp.]|uniref:pseudaminic acid cytidylyltransferase n=1 Tax=Idiomarina sp. TaxID=1874361 RepID=UPI001DBA2A22|nr:pseudaminic acid cytidylyltransferase [Idiomarina sp.]MCJ8317930.1 pseudaminic acid cytidylyltransferase [Idiomarina sp.]NQZ17585.1 pseudaminic acid cytidylyltransferase [Idiomarina sp.]